MRFSTAVNVFLLGVATVVSALPIAKFTSSQLEELESRGSFTLLLTWLYNSHQDLDDFQVDVPDMFEREIDEPALCKLEAFLQVKMVFKLLIRFNP